MSKLEDYLEKEEMVVKTIRAEKTLWEQIQEIANDHDCSLNHLVCSMLSKAVHDYYRGEKK